MEEGGRNHAATNDTAGFWRARFRLWVSEICCSGGGRWADSRMPVFLNSGELCFMGGLIGEIHDRLGPPVTLALPGICLPLAWRR